MINSISAGKNYGSMIEDIYLLLSKLFNINWLYLNKWPEVNFKVELFG